MYEQYRALGIDKKDGILTITLDNPPTNAVTTAMHAELGTIFKTINRDPEVKVVVVTGAGDKAFSAGGDIRHMVELLDDHARAMEGFKEAQELLYDLLRLEKPLIARINGHAIGLGATLALFSDLTYAVETAKIGDPHVQVGYAAGDGGALIWPQLIGYARAREYLLLGEPLTGKEAAEIGLITRAVPAERLDEVVNGVAERLAGGRDGGDQRDQAGDQHGPAAPVRGADRDAFGAGAGQLFLGRPCRSRARLPREAEAGLQRQVSRMLPRSPRARVNGGVKLLINRRPWRRTRRTGRSLQPRRCRTRTTGLSYVGFISIYLWAHVTLHEVLSARERFREWSPDVDLGVVNWLTRQHL